MSCCSLNVTDGVFGLSIMQSVLGQTAKRGEWVGLTLALKVTGGLVYATTPQTYNVAGLSVVVDPPVGGLVMVAVSGRTFALPWRPTIPRRDQPARGALCEHRLHGVPRGLTPVRFNVSAERRHPMVRSGAR